jgi:SnoaL-like protein
MAPQNVEMVRRAWEAFMRRDNEALLDLYDPEIELDLASSGWGLGRDVYRGHAGLQDFWRDFLAAWSEGGSEIERCGRAARPRRRDRSPRCSPGRTPEAS